MFYNSKTLMTSPRKLLDLNNAFIIVAGCVNMQKAIYQKRKKGNKSASKIGMGTGGIRQRWWVGEKCPGRDNRNWGWGHLVLKVET